MPLLLRYWICFGTSPVTSQSRGTGFHGRAHGGSEYQTISHRGHHLITQRVQYYTVEDGNKELSPDTIDWTVDRPILTFLTYSSYNNGTCNCEAANSSGTVTSTDAIYHLPIWTMEIVTTRKWKKGFRSSGIFNELLILVDWCFMNAKNMT